VVVLSGLLTFLIGIFSEIARSGSEVLIVLTSWIPGVWVLFLENSQESDGIAITSALLLLVLAWLFKLARLEFKRTAALEEKAARSLREEDS
jgi:hypothetical protein